MKCLYFSFIFQPFLVWQGFSREQVSADPFYKRPDTKYFKDFVGHMITIGTTETLLLQHKNSPRQVK